MKDHPILFNLINNHCSIPQIQSVLRKYKDINRKIIKIDGDNKESILGNLKQGYEESIIPIDDLYDLIRESEENGHQYIYYYKIKNSSHTKKYSNLKKITKDLFSSNGANKNFPNLLHLPQNFTWVDLRFTNGDNNGWTGKLYDKEERWKQISQKYLSNNLVKEYEKTIDRVVYVLKWLPSGLLELRISKTDSDSFKSRKSRLEAFWRKISPAIRKTEFEKWDLSNVRINLLEKRDNNSNIYILSGTKLKDLQKGVARFDPYLEDDDLFSAKARELAIDAYLNNNGYCNSLIVSFKADNSNRALDKNLRIIIGVYQTNEVLINSKIGSKEIDYVRKRLYEFD
jgi:hypothetical protein